jgi:hypothetical protein
MPIRDPGVIVGLGPGFCSCALRWMSGAIEPSPALSAVFHPSFSQPY